MTRVGSQRHRKKNPSGFREWHLVHWIDFAGLGHAKEWQFPNVSANIVSVFTAGCIFSWHTIQKPTNKMTPCLICVGLCFFLSGYSISCCRGLKCTTNLDSRQLHRNFIFVTPSIPFVDTTHVCLQRVKG